MSTRSLRNSWPRGIKYSAFSKDMNFIFNNVSLQTQPIVNFNFLVSPCFDGQRMVAASKF